MTYQHIHLPNNGDKLSIQDGKLIVPDQPILGFIEGDGIGRDISRAMLRVLDAAVQKAYANKKKIHWCELYLGEKAGQLYDGNFFPEETLKAIQELLVAIKGPLTTPVGGGFRSGLIYGRSDPIGGFPAPDPLVPGDIISTLFGCLGIAHNGEIHDRLDRPYRIVPAGDPQPQLLM